MVALQNPRAETFEAARRRRTGRTRAHRRAVDVRREEHLRDQMDQG